MYLPKKHTYNTKPGLKLKITQTNFTCQAIMDCYNEEDEDNEEDYYIFWDFSINTTIVADNVYNISNEQFETMGNFGSFIDSEFPEIEKDSLYSERHSIFDFDEFDISVKLESNEQYKQYICRFTPINSIHHAAAMFGKSCTIDYTFTDIESFLINEVTIKFVSKDNDYDVVTTYFGVDVL